jgi:signal transduction histidine kinase/ActR/RegA family two-component response regulator
VSDVAASVLETLRTTWEVLYLRVDDRGLVTDSNQYTDRLLGHRAAGVPFEGLVTTFDRTALQARPLPPRRFLNFMVQGTPRSVACTLLPDRGDILVLGHGDGREQELLRQVVALNRELGERTRSLHRTTAQLTRLTDGQARSLRSVEERFAAFTGESSSGMAIAGDDGGIVFSNRALDAMCGRTAAPSRLDEVCISPWSALRESVLPGVREHGAWRGECELRGPGEQRVEVELRVFDLHLNEPPLLGLIMTDVGPYKAVERRLREALAVAESANVARARFVANVSHELRTPMNAIIGLAGLGLDAAGPEKDGHLAQIRTAAEGLLSIVNEVLDFSRANAGHLVLAREPFALVAVVREAVALLRPGAEAKGLALVEELDPSLPAWVLGDGQRLRQVLLNLLGNGIKFTERGEVRVKVGATPTGAGPSNVAFEVQDTGRGVDPGLMPRLFQPFTQGDDSMTRRHGGTGLGLAYSQQLVRAMGAEIACDSTPGLGSTFHFEVALEPTDAPTPRLPTPVPSLHGVRALVVDDNRVNQRVAAGLLKKLGVAVSLAGDGQEAVEALRRSPAGFDVVLMDLQMPVMDGFAATRAIRQELRLEVPIIALTAHCRDEERAQGLAVGMNDHLTKPARLSVLGATLARWVRPVAAPPAP